MLAALAFLILTIGLTGHDHRYTVAGVIALSVVAAIAVIEVIVYGWKLMRGGGPMRQPRRP